MTHNIHKYWVLVCFAIGLAASNAVSVQAQSKSAGQPKQLKGISSLFDNARGTESSLKPDGPETERSIKPANIPAKSLSIEEWVQANGLPVLKKFDSGSVYTKFKLDKKEVSFLVHDIDSKQVVHFTMSLDKLADNSETHMNKLLNLLSLSFFGDSVRFVYLPKVGQIGLRGTVPRTKIAKKSIASKIKQMVFVKLKTEPRWNTKLWTVSRHVGTWSSSQTSTTLALKSDGRFEWNQELPKASVSTKGSFKITSDTLTLKDSTGKVIESKIYFINGNQFEIEINGQTIVLDRA